jgi:hypothetical protein
MVVGSLVLMAIGIPLVATDVAREVGGVLVVLGVIGGILTTYGGAAGAGS